MYLEDLGGETVWSPCSKFIAITKQISTGILDAVTLNHLHTFEHPPKSNDRLLSFSPDSRFLTQLDAGELTSWDLQTGSPLDTAHFGSSGSPPSAFSTTYSKDGKMIAIAYKDSPRDQKDDDDHHHHNHGIFITICDLFGTRIHTHQILEGPIIPPIWTHDQCFRFATIKPSSITIWEVAFASTHGPAEVESLPVPDEVADCQRLLFCPPLSRLAFILRDTIQIWDAKASRLLLKSELSPDFLPDWNATRHPSWGSFSFDGHFFASRVNGGVYVWKESPSCYILHQQLAFSIPFDSTGPRLSPNGESIIIPLHSTIQLWHTRDQILSAPNVPAKDGNGCDFVLGFSPNGLFAGFVRRGGNAVKIIGLRSGDLLSVADVGLEIECLWMTESTVVVIGEGKVVSWNLPGETGAVDVEVNASNDIQTTILNRSSPSLYFHMPLDVSISPDLSRVAVSGYSAHPREPGLEIYDVSTGRCLGGTGTETSSKPRFTLDGHEIRDVADYSNVVGWKIIEGSEPGAVDLKPLGRTAHSQGVFPLQSSRGYEVTDDGWVLSPAKKRLLWLPHRWRSTWRNRAWGGQFLGLSHRELPEAVILEF